MQIHVTTTWQLWGNYHNLTQERQLQIVGRVVQIVFSDWGHRRDLALPNTEQRHLLKVCVITQRLLQFGRLNNVCACEYFPKNILNTHFLWKSWKVSSFSYYSVIYDAHKIITMIMHSFIFQPEFHLFNHYRLYARGFTRLCNKMMYETQNSAQVDYVPTTCHSLGPVKEELRD